MPEKKKEVNADQYLKLRKAVGIIGMALPFVLLVGMVVINMTFENVSALEYHYPESISHYYYSILRGVFVGAMCAVGLFMFYYAGYTKLDNRNGNIAGLAAVTVAWFPTSSSGSEMAWYSVIHYLAAVLFFGCLAFFCIKLFTKTSKENKPTPRKLFRNRIYRTCGWLMIVCMICMGVYSFVIEKYVMHIHYFTWTGEAIALLLFGFSWLIKGGVLYNDLEMEDVVE